MPVPIHLNDLQMLFQEAQHSVSDEWYRSLQRDVPPSAMARPHPLKSDRATFANGRQRVAGRALEIAAAEERSTASAWTLRTCVKLHDPRGTLKLVQLKAERMTSESQSHVTSGAR